jgi:hypothetical protein
MMWWLRQLHVLQHNFWWAEPGVVAQAHDTNPGLKLLVGYIKIFVFI